MDEEFYEIIAPYLSSRKVQQMKQYIQHGNVSTFEHCVDVAKLCFTLNRGWNLGAEEETLVTAALLHDLYLYDWHAKDRGLHRLHGYRHPGRAAKNAARYFGVNREVQKIIQTHMWPLTITRIPRSREAWILCLADKYVSWKESVTKRKKKGTISKC